MTSWPKGKLNWSFVVALAHDLGLERPEAILLDATLLAVVRFPINSYNYNDRQAILASVTEAYGFITISGRENQLELIELAPLKHDTGITVPIAVSTSRELESEYASVWKAIKEPYEAVAKILDQYEPIEPERFVETDDERFGMRFSTSDIVNVIRATGNYKLPLSTTELRGNDITLLLAPFEVPREVYKSFLADVAEYYSNLFNVPVGAIERKIRQQLHIGESTGTVHVPVAQVHDGDDEDSWELIPPPEHLLPPLPMEDLNDAQANRFANLEDSDFVPPELEENKRLREAEAWYREARKLLDLPEDPDGDSDPWLNRIKNLEPNPKKGVEEVYAIFINEDEEVDVQRVTSAAHMERMLEEVLHTDNQLFFAIAKNADGAYFNFLKQKTVSPAKAFNHITKHYGGSKKKH